MELLAPLKGLSKVDEAEPWTADEVLRAAARVDVVGTRRAEARARAREALLRDAISRVWRREGERLRYGTGVRVGADSIDGGMLDWKLSSQNHELRFFWPSLFPLSPVVAVVALGCKSSLAAL